MFEEIMKKQRIRGINMMAQQIQHMWGGASRARPSFLVLNPWLN